MELTDNQLAAIVFIMIALTISLFHVNNQFLEQGDITYSIEYPQTVIYINIVILFMCFLSIVGLVKLLQRIKGK